MVNERIRFSGETPADLVFDDEPVDSILYGPSPIPPTEASIFAPARRLVEEIRSGQGAPGFNTLLDKCNRFLEEHPPTIDLVDALYELAGLLERSGMRDEAEQLLSKVSKYANPGTDK
jgi:hypothetical protein